MNLSTRIPAEFSKGEALLFNELIPTALQYLAGQFCQFVALIEAQQG
jgi:hypothetical protein